MNKKAIRRPTGPAVIFLLTGLGFVFTIINSIILPQIIETLEEMPSVGIFKFVLWSVSHLFISIILFSKKYNNMLIIGTGVLLLPSLIALFWNITPYLMIESLFYLVLFVFAYIMVKKPETPIREKAVKVRFIIPLFQFILILISTIQSLQGLYENLTETMGTSPTGAMNVVMVLLPSILSAITGFLPVLCYVWLANWMANPYEK